MTKNFRPPEALGKWLISGKPSTLIDKIGLSCESRLKFGKVQLLWWDLKTPSELLVPPHTERWPFMSLGFSLEGWVRGQHSSVCFLLWSTPITPSSPLLVRTTRPVIKWQYCCLPQGRKPMDLLLSSPQNWLWSLFSSPLHRLCPGSGFTVTLLECHNSLCFLSLLLSSTIHVTVARVTFLRHG